MGPNQSHGTGHMSDISERRIETAYHDCVLRLLIMTAYHHPSTYTIIGYSDQIGQLMMHITWTQLKTENDNGNKK